MNHPSSLQDFITHIKRKPELRSLPDSFVREMLQKSLREKPALFKVFSHPRSEAYTQFLKHIRRQLRLPFGIFHAPLPQNIEHLLTQRVGIIKLLQSHPSTAERLAIYPNLYSSIFRITGHPKSILDLGCGLNPLSAIFLPHKDVLYSAYDLNTDEIQLLRKFFSLSSLTGRAEVLDLFQKDSLSKLPSADLCFLFKITDIVDRGKGHHATEYLLDHLSCPWMVVSFATRTLSGKAMTAPRRRWMEWLCQRKKYWYTMLRFPDEIFYIIKK